MQRIWDLNYTILNRTQKQVKKEKEIEFEKQINIF